MAPYLDRSRDLIGSLGINQSLIVTFHILGENKTYRALVGGDSKKDYDSVGAVYYVLAVLLIYGISIVLLILAIVRGRDNHQHLDKQVASYLKNAEFIRQQGETETLKKSLEVRLPQGVDCKLSLISECTEQEGTESDTGAYYGPDSPMPSPRMERRLSRSESNLYLTIPGR